MTPARGHRPDDAEAAWLARLDASITPAAAAPALIHLPRPHPAALPPEALLAQCDMTRGRSSGPGGQHRNKVETLVTLDHTPTGLQAHAGERRSAIENKHEALWRLRLVLATHARCPVPAGDARSTLWQSRCTGSGKRAGRVSVSPTHDDYPAMLAEALDVVFACGLDMPAAAARLCCSASQLLKLVKDHPPALVLLNAHRAASGLRVLK